MKGKDFRLAKEIEYIQRRAAEHDGRIVAIGPLIFFSTETGDAWMLDPSCQLAARLARVGDPEPIDFEETDTNYAIDWKGNYRIEGQAFVYIDRKSGRIMTVLGYPTAQIERRAQEVNDWLITLVHATCLRKEQWRDLARRTRRARRFFASSIG
jgi:hypothetical protein